MEVFLIDDAGAIEKRIAVLGVGTVGQSVLEICRAQGVEARLIESRPPAAHRATETQLARQQTSPEDKPTLREASGAVLLFIAGTLNGELLETLTYATQVVPERTQAIVTIAVLPPSFHGHEARSAAVGELEALTAAGATAVVIDSDRALRELSPNDPMSDYERVNANEAAGIIQAITDVLVVTGEVNVDFADIVLVLHRGTAGYFATGRAAGTDRAQSAAQQALTRAAYFPAHQGGAKGCLINISGGLSLTIEEVTTIAGMVQDVAGEDAEIVFGAVHDPELGDTVVVSTLWTGYQPSAVSYDHTHAILTANSKPDQSWPSGRRRSMSSSLKVFLASPSDVTDDRAAVRRVVEELNLQNAGRWGTYLELISWETHAVPAMGRSQGVVAQSTKYAEVDVFIGLLWSKLGTPTGEADSGTVEEFNEAYASWRKHGRPWIAFYFCDRPLEYGGIGAAEQYLGVARFREQFPDKGLYFTYGQTQQLEQLLFRHLPRIVEQVLDKREP